MKSLAILAVLLTLSGHPAWAHNAAAASLDLGTFQAPDGAITITEGGMIVEPYFALKALLIAKEAGIDVDAPTERFMNWMSADAKGSEIGDWPRFGRSCRTDPGANWTPCAKADADDALLALWLTTLAEVPKAHPRITDVSASERALSDLRYRGVYQINADTKVALLMDNAEIANSFSERARLARLHHQPRTASRLNAESATLLAAMPKVFPSDDGLPAASTQTERQTAFYPDQVLPMFLEEENVPTRGFSPALLSYENWMARYREPWLHGDADAFPWGLVAIVADRHKDEATVDCWLQRAETLRHGPHWNVLEEAVWQSLLTHRSFPRNAMTC